MKKEIFMAIAEKYTSKKQLFIHYDDETAKYST
jgi:hypothetical protein